jgi:hypothetical protein
MLLPLMMTFFFLCVCVSLLFTSCADIVIGTLKSVLVTSLASQQLLSSALQLDVCVCVCGCYLKISFADTVVLCMAFFVVLLMFVCVCGWVGA